MSKNKTLFFTLFTIILVILIGGAVLVSQAGEKKKAFLGVVLTNLDDDLCKTLNYKGDGVFVKQVVDDSPADDAGIKEGDIITKFDGKTVSDEANLRKLIKDHSPGDKVDIVVMRDGISQTLKAELGKNKGLEIITDLGGDPMCALRLIEPGLGSIFCLGEDRGFLGLKLQDMSDQLAEYFGVKNGALVGEVVKDSPAEKAGIKAGDIITEFDSKRVDDQDDLHYYLKKTKPDEEYSLKLSRKGAAMTVKVKLAKAPDCGKCDCKGSLKCLKCDLNGKQIELQILGDKLKCLECLPVDIEQCEKDGKKIIKIKIDED